MRCLFGKRSVGAIDLVGAGFIVPAAALDYRIPLSFRAFEVDACEASAIFERIDPDARNPVSDCYACKSTAILERIRAYARNTVADCYARKATAIIERRIAYARDAVRDFDARKATAT